MPQASAASASAGSCTRLTTRASAVNTSRVVGGADVYVADIQEGRSKRRRGGTMAGKSDFTAEEWEQLRKGLAGSALLVSVSDPGLFEAFKEAGTAARD